MRVLIQKIITLVFLLGSMPVFAGTTHTVTGPLKNPNTTIPGDSDVAFTAYITTRTGETITNSSSGAGYASGYWYLNTGNFSTAWTVGEELTVQFQNQANGGTLTITQVLTSAGTDTVPESTFVVVAGDPAIVLVEASDSVIPVGQSTAINATISDQHGNPVPNQSVSFSTGALGSVSPASATTNASGIATTTLTAGNTVGTNVINITVSDATGTVSVTGIAGSASGATSQIEATSDIVADGVTTSNLTFTVTDQYGNPVNGEQLFVVSSGSGSVTQAASTTETGGVRRQT